MIDLRNYQEKYTEKLKDEINEIIALSDEKKICIFQSPTGSGKTVIVSECLKRIVEGRADKKKFSFVWISVRKLHDQSKDKIERYYADSRELKCSYFWDLEDRMIKENEILFINWESINKKDKNTIIKDNEQEFYLEKVIERTKEGGREIILVIDESHHTASSEKSRELIDIISPKVILEVSATPHLKEYQSKFVKVELEEVREEEMIKKEIIVNPEFMNKKASSKDSDEFIIEQALKKREELAGMYKKEKARINPLVLLQLPNQGRGLENKKDKIIRMLKDKFKITEENGKLAIWLSDQKSETMNNIVKNENEVNVLIFKEAIALGWDCPRAVILVVFREYSSFQFTIQTIGRIMRMPELKYYEEDELNKGFIFTNISGVEAKITEDYAKDYISIYESKRRANLYDRIKLFSVYLKRQRERTRLSGKFAEIFMKIAEKINLHKKLDMSPSKPVNPIISDGKIIDLDKVQQIKHKGQIELKLTEMEIQNRFDKFVWIMCSPYAPFDSSDRMKTAIYNFFEKKIKIKKYDPRVQRIVLGKGNYELFEKAIVLSKDAYEKEIVEKIGKSREVEETPAWEIPVSDYYNSTVIHGEYKKAIMKPVYTKKQSKPEEEFIKLLEKSKKIKWWYKNRESEKKYFAVKYKDESGYDRSFYVDFIVMFNDGKIGLFDTKSGTTAVEAGPRSNGLQIYIREQNKKGKKLWGGIVVNVRGIWRYFDKEKYEYDDLSGWKVLEI